MGPSVAKFRYTGQSRFSVRVAEKIEQAEAKTNQDQIILKQIEPAFIEPMQCKPVASLPVGEKWAFELKLDGYRCIAVKHGKEVTVFSRHEKVLNQRFPGVVDALASLKSDFVLDGELVALDPQGRPSFKLLQGLRLHIFQSIFTPSTYWTKMPNFCWVSPFRSRRAVLESLLAGAPEALRISPLLQAPSGQILEAVRKLGLEGVVGKRLDSRLRAWRAIRGLDQASHEHGAGVRHRRLRPRNAQIRCVARRRLREQGTRLRGQGEERLGPKDYELSVQKSARKTVVTMGETITAERCRNADGSNRSWSARSLLWSGLMPGICVIAPSLPCAMTRSLRKWFAKPMIDASIPAGCASLTLVAKL
jgi:hypothetical protein